MPGQRGWVLLLVLALLAGAATLPAQPTRELVSGEVRSGALSGDHVAQVYTFTGARDDQVSLQVEVR